MLLVFIVLHILFIGKRKQFRKNCKRQQLYINLMQEYEDVSFQNHFRMSKSTFEVE